MSDWAVLYPGKFLQKETLTVPKTIRILEVQQLTLTCERDGKDVEEQKVVIKYEAGKGEKGEIPWNKTNAALTAFALDERDYLKWVGRMITILHDPTVAFGGQQVGGIRVCGSPEMKAAKRIEIKRPRRKRPEIYHLTPTPLRNGAKAQTQPAPPPAPEPSSDDTPPPDDDDDIPF